MFSLTFPPSRPCMGCDVAWPQISHNAISIADAPLLSAEAPIKPVYPIRFF